MNKKGLEQNLDDQAVREIIANRVLVLWAVAAVVALAFVFLRAKDIGWGLRDVMQTVMAAAIVFAALFRAHLPVMAKVAFLGVSSLSMFGVGFYTLGMTSGAIFCLHLFAMIVGFFCTRRMVVVLSLLALLVIALIGAGFITDTLHITNSPEVMLANSVHWAGYTFGLSITFAIIVITIQMFHVHSTRLITNLRVQQEALEQSNTDLQQTLAELNQLRGVLSTCQHCKKIRRAGEDEEDSKSWIQMETYISEHSEAQFSHGICPDCLQAHYGDITKLPDA